MDKIQEIDREIMRLNQERLKIRHPLRQLFWECTLRCNMSCLHCGSDCKKEVEQQDMPLEHFLPVLDEIKLHQAKTKTIVFTVGGEPLVRPDIAECGYEITKKGFYWGMVSNAMLLSEYKMKELSRNGLCSIAIDLDGLEPQHNWLRQSDVSFDHAFRAITHLKEAPHLAWDIITCVNQRNLPHLDELKRMLIDAGVTKWRCFTIVPMGRAKDKEELQLSNEQLHELMEFIVRTRQEGKIDLSYACEGFLGDYEGKVRKHHFACRAGLTVASVLSNGDISGCLSIRSQYHQGNIYKESFWDVWQNRFEKYRNREWMRTDECAGCDMFRYCQGNGMHLRNDDGTLMTCHYKRLFVK